jgi:nucleotide-binding universal stress UspA family protein
MTYATVMVHLELGDSNAGLLRIAGDLAERFKAKVIGIATCQLLQFGLGDGYVGAEVVQQNLEEIEKEIRGAELEFRSALQTCAAELEWRSAMTLTALYDYLAEEARAADLFLTKVDRTASLFDGSRHLNIGDLVMKVGRPVLIVPTARDELDLGHVVLGWKEAREARRAAADALPLLKRSGHVTVVEIAPRDQMAAAERRLRDVVAWLGRHGVAAEPLVSPSSGDDVEQFDTIVRTEDAGLVVAGAYGHGRLREWVLGGVTRDLLLRADHCALVSH